MNQRVCLAGTTDEETMRFYGHEPHRSLDETRASIEQAQARYTRREAIRWGINLKGEDQIIGSCSFHHFGPGFHRAETGYDLNRAFWGQGHADTSTECAYLPPKHSPTPRSNLTE